MFIDDVEISTPCPLCNFENDFTIKQARLRDVIICRGCKANIQLDDQMNECRKATRSVEKTLQELQNTISNLNMTI